MATKKNPFIPFQKSGAKTTAPAKKMSPAQFEKSGKDNDKGVKEGSKADIDRDISEGLMTKKPMKKARK